MHSKLDLKLMFSSLSHMDQVDHSTHKMDLEIARWNAHCTQIEDWI